MVDAPDTILIEYLRRIRASQERVEPDVADVKLRLSTVDQHFGQIQIRMAGLNSRMDRFDERLSRVERRLDLVDVS